MPRRSCSYLVLRRRRESLSAPTAPVGNIPAPQGSDAGEPRGPAPHARPPAAGDNHRGREGDAPNPGPRVPAGRHLRTGAALCERNVGPTPCVLREQTFTLPGCNSHNRRRVPDTRRRHESATGRAGMMGVAAGRPSPFAGSTLGSDPGTARLASTRPLSSSPAPGFSSRHALQRGKNQSSRPLVWRSRQKETQRLLLPQVRLLSTYFSRIHSSPWDWTSNKSFREPWTLRGHTLLDCLARFSTKLAPLRGSQ